MARGHSAQLGRRRVDKKRPGHLDSRGLQRGGAISTGEDASGGLSKGGGYGYCQRQRACLEEEEARKIT